MKSELIKEEDVAFFFNKYKYNSDQIFHLERRLLNSSCDFEKWESMLDANSQLTRALFTENEHLISEYIQPVFMYPELVAPDTIHAFILHITFFLFENNLDTLITEELIAVILKKYPNLSDSDRFDANLCFGMSKILLATSDFEDSVHALNEALKIYPDVNSVPSDLNIKLHVIFCKTYKMIAFNIFKNPDTEAFLELYESVEKDVRCGNEELYKIMWSESSDFTFHIELLLRLFKFYGIFLCTFTGFKNKRLNSWLEQEFETEEREGYINPMIFTLHYKLQFENQEISIDEYKNLLSSKMMEICKETPFEYPESAFPIDDDPVPEQKALLLEKMKLFNSSFTTATILLPELFKISQKDSEIRERIVISLFFYYTNAKYAEKGFQTDRFVIENLIDVAECFDSVSEFIPFLQSIMVHRQINSAIHFSMVSNLTGMCVAHFLETHPEYFVSRQFPSVDSVLQHRTDILQFMKEAAFLHDIGKLGRTNFVNLHFRKITDREYEELKDHTQLGYELAEKVSFIKQYSAFILCHHKFFNDKGGYPSKVKTSTFEFKAFLDILTICDTIDTATDYRGRNYAAKKTFDEVLVELKELKNRYNPDFIKVIEEDEALKEELRYMTSTGRIYTSYEIFHKYVQPHTVYSANSEKSVVAYNPQMESELKEFLGSEKQMTENEISTFLAEIQNPSSNTLVLADKNKEISGILTGERGKIDSSDFFLKDIYISSDCRHLGWATEMLIQIQISLKLSGFESITLDMPEKTVEGFFWINGFIKKAKMMKKNI